MSPAKVKPFALDDALRILGRATVEDAEHARDVIRLSITLSE